MPRHRAFSDHDPWQAYRRIATPHGDDQEQHGTPSLNEEFLEQIGQTVGRPPSGLTRDAKEALTHYDWPGTVRELRNALERVAIL